MWTVDNANETFGDIVGTSFREAPFRHQLDTCGELFVVDRIVLVAWGIATKATQQHCGQPREVEPHKSMMDEQALPNLASQVSPLVVLQ